jgi:hypothetical protein
VTAVERTWTIEVCRTCSALAYWPFCPHRRDNYVPGQRDPGWTVQVVVTGQWTPPTPASREPASAEPTWFLLWCHGCEMPPEAPMPFESTEARTDWLTEHRAGTGHDRFTLITEPERVTGRWWAR